MSGNDSVVVLRLPTDLKNTLQNEAESMSVSLSEMIRLKLMAMNRGEREEPVLRLKGQEIRLEEIFLPEVLSHGYAENTRRKEIEIEVRKIVRKKLGPVEIKSGKGFFEINLGKTSNLMSEEVSALIEAATREAARLGSEEIACEHLLLGVMREDLGEAVPILRKLGVDTSELASTLEQSIGKGKKRPAGGEIMELTNAAHKVLRIAALEAKLCRADETGSEHLLLALLRDREEVVSNVLREYGVTYERVMSEIV
jgi:hypothetical protein